MVWKAAASRYAEDVTRLLNQALDNYPNLPGELKSAMAYSLFAGGKRVRPFLALATADMLQLPQDKVVHFAAALECIHTYSLIHDDLPAMDDDDLRRGKPTCHIVYGEDIAILAGDALQTLAFELISQDPSLSAQEAISAVKVLSSASGFAGMCGGQSVDLFQEGKSIQQNELELMHRMKTGALINASIEFPTLLAGLTANEAEQLNRFGRAIGLGFQVLDDILDIEGNTEELGKPQGSDIHADKSTYPALMGMQGAKQYLQQLHNEANQALLTLPYNTETLLSFTDYLFSRNH